MKALVTGATGFLGGHLVKRLIDEGCEVFAIGRNLKKKVEIETTGADFYCVDLLDVSDLNDLSINVDVVFHCAAFSSAWGKRRDFFAHNVNATENLLRWSLKQRVKRFIYVSSSSLYFNYNDRLMIAETDPVAQPFVNAYAESKYLGERLCLDFEFRTLEPVIIRPRGILGEGDTSIMPRILQVVERGKFPLMNNGEALVDATYVGNVVEAMFLGAKSKGVGGHCFNISNDEPMTVKNLLTIAFKALDYSVNYKHVPYGVIDSVARALELWSKVTTNKEPVITRYSAGLLAFSQTLDITKAKEALGYQPKLSLAEGMLRYAQWR